MQEKKTPMNKEVKHKTAKKIVNFMKTDKFELVCILFYILLYSLIYTFQNDLIVKLFILTYIVPVFCSLLVLLFALPIHKLSEKSLLLNRLFQLFKWLITVFSFLFSAILALYISESFKDVQHFLGNMSSLIYWLLNFVLVGGGTLISILCSVDLYRLKDDGRLKSIERCKEFFSGCKVNGYIERLQKPILILRNGT